MVEPGVVAITLRHGEWAGRRNSSFKIRGVDSFVYGSECESGSTIVREEFTEG